MSDDFRAGDFWAAVAGEEHAGQAMLCVQMAGQLDPEALREGIAAINHETSLGPMMNPTAYMGGARSDNARLIQRVLGALADLAEAEQARNEGWRNDARGRVEDDIRLRK